MSAIADFRPRAAGDSKRPSLSGLIWSVLAGEVQAAVTLWVVAIPIGGLGLAPLGSSEEWFWLPWRVNGVWALVGAIGWGYLISAGVAWFVAGSLTRHDIHLPSTPWLQIAIAVSGYGGMALGTTGFMRVACAVVLGGILVRWLVLQADGTTRIWPWALSRRARVLITLAAALIGFSYSATHAFVADGSGGSYGASVANLRVGQSVTVSVGMNQMRFGVEIQSASLTGPGASNLRATPVILNFGTPVGFPSPALLRQIPKRYDHLYVVHSTHFPFKVSPGRELWVNARVTLRACGSGTLNRLKLRYTVFGIQTAVEIPVQPVTLNCANPDAPEPKVTNGP